MQVAKIKQTRPQALPGRFEQLVKMMPPQAIRNDGQNRKMLDMIDRLKSRKKLTRGQALYRETLVQLVQAYEAEHHRIDPSRTGKVACVATLHGRNAESTKDLATGEPWLQWPVSRYRTACHPFD